MATAGISLDATRTNAPPARSTWGLIQLALFWVATNYHWAAIPIIILPSQVRVYLFTHHPAGFTGDALANYIKDTAPGTLAAIVGPGLIVALIANPLFGYLSDRTRLRWGRRLPYILGGTLLNIVGLGIMATAQNVPTLIGGLMLAQLANNAAAAPFHALLPDLVPAAQRGKASGFMGLGQMLGTIIGSTVPGIVLGVNAQSVIDGTQSVDHYQQTVYLAYGFTAGFILLMALLTVFTVKERPLSERADMPVAGAGMPHLARDLGLTIGGIGVAIAATVGVMLVYKLDLGTESAQNILILPALLVGTLGVAKAFDFRPRQHADFAWVLLTRAIMMMGIYTVLSFLQLYLKYVTFAGVANAPKPEDATGFFFDITILTAALSTAFAGALSDRLGRKRMVYISGFFMALVGLIFLGSPLALPGLSVPITFICAGIFGLGYGAYVSVDWALVTDVLPSEANFARDMGIWNVALTTPQVLSYIIGAFVIAALGSVAFAGYGSFGYTMLFVMQVIYAIVGTITVRFIKSVKR